MNKHPHQVTCTATFLILLISLLIPFAVPAQSGNVVLWNKLGSVSEITHSEIGPGLIPISYLVNNWQEAAITPAKFGNGLYVNHDINEGWSNNGANFFAANLTQTQLTPARGTIEFWFQFKYGAETFNHAYFFDNRNQLLSHYPDQNWVTGVSMAAGWNGWDYGTFGKRFFFCELSVCAYTPDYSAAPNGELAFSNGTLMHLAFVWDVSGIAGTKDTIRIYVNGALKGKTQAIWSASGHIDPYLFIGSAPNCCNWDTAYNAVKGVTDNLIIWDYAKTDFSDRFNESPVNCDVGVLPKLAAGVNQKSGTQNSRVWTISLSNNSYCPAENAQIDSLVLTQTAGTACTPVITSPFSFPLGVGNIAAGAQASGTATINFTGCPNNARFKATIPFSSNNGAVTGSKTLNNQFR